MLKFLFTYIFVHKNLGVGVCTMYIFVCAKQNTNVRFD